ncbi:hypothetical protein SCHPADRAFT_1000837 [Schizopora paradoxa]|uniref:SH3 domain-containing protein n=1 Tax=Schizopora paradoxa TaxID=27342 RepID=A0A0H2R9R4_9AGAM|nr:hypothetical protein SCHPADRAFT_1000837 [Schizopora paradoxa]
MAAATMAQQNNVADVVMSNGNVNGKTIGSPKEKKANKESQSASRPSLSLETPFYAKAVAPFPSPSSALVPPPDLSESLKLKPMSSILNGRSPSPTKVFIPPPPLSPSLQLSSPPSTPKPQRVPADSVSTPVTPQASSHPSHSKALSISSSRRAPPSPSMSRRTSGASKRLSTASVRSTRNRSSLSQSISALSSLDTATTRKPAAIKIKDFAYSPQDERHIGKGADAPRPNRRQSCISTTSSSSSRRSSGWGAFKWASGGGSRFWGFGFGKGSNTPDEDDDDNSRPSRSDFERNFDMSSPTEEQAPFDDEDSSSSDHEYTDADGALLPGLYRAMYAFSPEGETEMALEENQVVHVVGRGGGQGWAVVIREGADIQGDRHALVPESYLELVKLDDVDGDE